MLFSERLKPKGQPLKSSTAVKEQISALESEIEQANTDAEQAQKRRKALLLDGSTEDIRQCESEVSNALLRAERAVAARPALLARLVELEGAERKQAIESHLKAIEAVAPQYIAAALALPEAASAFHEARTAFAAKFPQEALGLADIVPVALDLGAMQGNSPRIQAPPEVRDFDLQLSENLASIRRRNK